MNPINLEPQAVATLPAREPGGMLEAKDGTATGASFTLLCVRRFKAGMNLWPGRPPAGAHPSPGCCK